MYKYLGAKQKWNKDSIIFGVSREYLSFDGALGVGEVGLFVKSKTSCKYRPSLGGRLNKKLVINP